MEHNKEFEQLKKYMDYFIARKVLNALERRTNRYIWTFAEWKAFGGWHMPYDMMYNPNRLFTSKTQIP